MLSDAFQANCGGRTENKIFSRQNEIFSIWSGEGEEGAKESGLRTR